MSSCVRLALKIRYVSYRGLLEVVPRSPFGNNGIMIGF
jgi:hypothetical protein